MTLSAARQARVDELENAAELLAAKNRELEDTAAALRRQLSENAAQNQRIADLQAIVENLHRQAAEQRPLLDVIATSVQQIQKGQS